MVFGVCLRILMNHHDAEEAFQATFLVLARKAKSLQGRSSIAGWLHEVAQRTALNARRTRTPRQVREQQVEQIPEALARTEGAWKEAVPLLDQELSRLPEKYRIPILLCDLEGISQPEAARQVGCPLGTLSSRLTRAREMLRIRLIRQGVAMSTGALMIAILQQSASASVTTRLVTSTLQMVRVSSTTSLVTAGAIPPQVATLTEGVLKAMFFSTIQKITAALLLIAAAGLGAGGLMYQMHAAEPTANQPKDIEMLNRLRGEWKAVRAETKGKVQAERELAALNPRMTFTETTFRLTRLADNKDHSMEGALKIDTSKDPFEIDLSNLIDQSSGQRLPFGIKGIFDFDGDKLRIRLKGHVNGKDQEGKPFKRPTSLESTEPTPKNEAVDALWTLERQPKAAEPRN